MKRRLTNRELWLRALFMVLFAIAYSIAELIIIVVVIVQFFIVLFSGRANENLLGFGNNLSVYVYQILRFETFNTETRPYPFSPWPNEEPESNRWVDETPPASRAPADDPPGGATPAVEEPTPTASPSAGESDGPSDHRAS